VDHLDRRVGIPITLSVVYLEVARRVAVLAQGVNFPGFVAGLIDGVFNAIVTASRSVVAVMWPCSSRTASHSKWGELCRKPSR